MKMNQWLLLSGLLAITASGCATYHGPPMNGMAGKYPPSYWDTVQPRTYSNVFDPAMGWNSPYDRYVPPVN
jgi:hypothetical protein